MAGRGPGGVRGTDGVQIEGASDAFLRVISNSTRLFIREEPGVATVLILFQFSDDDRLDDLEKSLFRR